PPRSTLFPYTTLFRSLGRYAGVEGELGVDLHRQEAAQLPAARLGEGALLDDVDALHVVVAGGRRRRRNPRCQNTRRECERRRPRSEEHTSELQSPDHL